MKRLMDSHSPVDSFMRGLLLNGKRLLIITGEVNSGKTSTVERMILDLQSLEKNVGGVYSKGIFADNIKLGFNIVDIKSSESKQFSSITANENFNFNQGRYYFNQFVFDEYNNKLINSLNADVIFIDEIGYLELRGKGFYPSVDYLLDHFKGKLVFVIRSILLDEVLYKFNLDIKDIDVIKAF